MPNIGSILKDEITRLSKRVVREHIGSIHTATSAHRKQLVVLKKQVQQLQRELALLRRGSTQARAEPETVDGAQYRFSAKGLKSLRSRLSLSAEDFGRLVKVGPQTIYNWEHEKTMPRPAQVPVIAELRGIGKREAQQRLDALNAV
jgi:DNA-binding transcriptional regulator YiaG